MILCPMMNYGLFVVVSLTASFRNTIKFICQCLSVTWSQLKHVFLLTAC